MNPTIDTRKAQIANYLNTYKGNFSFILDLRVKLARYKDLSDRQWDAAEKVMRKDQDFGNTVANTAKAVDETPIVYTHPIEINFRTAISVAKEQRWKFNPMTFNVHEIISYDGRKMLKLRVSINWEGTASVCRCCGRALTDWRSQATGVGPVCVKHLPIPYVKNKQDVDRFQKSMKALCDTIGVVEIEISKYAIVQSMRDHMMNAIQLEVKNRLAAVATPEAPKANDTDQRVDRIINYLRITNSLAPNVNTTTLKTAINNLLNH